MSPANIIIKKAGVNMVATVWLIFNFVFKNFKIGLPINVNTKAINK